MVWCGWDSLTGGAGWCEARQSRTCLTTCSPPSMANNPTNATTGGAGDFTLSTP